MRPVKRLISTDGGSTRMFAHTGAGNPTARTKQKSPPFVACALGSLSGTFSKATADGGHAGLCTVPSCSAYLVETHCAVYRSVLTSDLCYSPPPYELPGFPKKRVTVPRARFGPFANAPPIYNSTRVCVRLSLRGRAPSPNNPSCPLKRGCVAALYK